MRQLFSIAFLSCFLLPASLEAQSIFNKIKDRAAQTAERKILNTTEKVVDKSLEGKPVSKPSEKKAEKTIGETKTATTESPEKSIKSYAKYDFIAGEKIIYQADFKSDVSGELAAGWNTNGSGAVSSIEGIEGKWLKMAQQAVYLPIADLATSDNFTVEFDMILDFNFLGYGYPEVKFGMLSTGKKAAGDNILLSDQQSVKNAQVDIMPGFQSRTFMAFASHDKGSRHFHISNKPLNQLETYYQKVSHVAMHFQGERLRLWINGQKELDVPKAIPTGPALNQLYFSIGTSNYTAEQVGIYLGNIRVANGASNPREKLLKNGSFVTSAILFDVNTSVIRPQSNGMLLEIAKALNEDPEMKLLITGHTDSDGNAAANQKLSLNRAESVKEALVAQGISGARLQVDGKGATQPINTAASAEAKTQNRRVEFKRI